MFLRINSSGKYRYIQILHNYRENGKSKHKIITPLGHYDKERYTRLKKELKDWKPMSRAVTIISEMKTDIANIKKHAKPFTKGLNYKHF
ncbi:MAG: hypothetical protein L6305_09245 [Actinomycetia bacterium]|nr:hypothetical protein [Actinomycetes bacterium]